MTSLQVQVKKEMEASTAVSEAGDQTAAKDPALQNGTAAGMSLPAVSLAQAGMSPTAAVSMQMPFVSGMIGTPQALMAATPGPNGGNPVLVVPQPFPQFMQFYRPQFATTAAATTAAVAATVNMAPQVAAPDTFEASGGALDLSKTGKSATVESESEPGLVREIPYQAKERRRGSGDEDELIADMGSPAGSDKDESSKGKDGLLKTGGNIRGEHFKRR